MRSPASPAHPPGGRLDFSPSRGLPLHAAHIWEGSRFGTHDLRSHPGFAMGGLEQTSLSFNRLTGDREKTTAQARSECQVIRTVGSGWGTEAQPMPLLRLPWGSQPPGLRLCTCRLNLPSRSDPPSGGGQGTVSSQKSQETGGLRMSRSGHVRSVRVTWPWGTGCPLAPSPGVC